MLAWSIVLVILASLLINVFIEDNKGRNFRKNLAVDYATAYKHPVIVPTKTPYTITFDDKWGQIEITQAMDAADEFKNDTSARYRTW